jgi:hypothetical protein
MRGTPRIVALTLLACASLAGCERLDQQYVGELQVSEAELKDAIPADYGRLVGVGSQHGLLRLVFERADQALVVVTLSAEHESLVNRVIVVPRR